MTFPTLCQTKRKKTIEERKGKERGEKNGKLK
jgi:hypothetical protein